MKELTCRFSGVLAVVSRDASESMTNWMLSGDEAVGRESFRWAPNTCADEMDIFPKAKEAKSTFTVIRAALNIGRCLWSLMSTSSRMMRLRNPISTRPIETCVPKVLPMASARWLPNHCCTEVVWIAITTIAYRPNKVHTTQLMICFRILTCWQLEITIFASVAQLCCKNTTNY